MDSKESHKIPLREVFHKMNEIINDIMNLLENKTSDYGDIRENDPFGSFGILVRMNDKMRRLISLHEKGMNGEGAKVDESRKDTVKDLVGYALWYLIVLEDEERSRSDHIIIEPRLIDTNQK